MTREIDRRIYQIIPIGVRIKSSVPFPKSLCPNLAVFFHR